MSRVYFHSPSDEAELRGSERAWMGGAASDALVQALGLDRGFQRDEWLRSVADLVERDDGKTWEGSLEHLETSLRVSMRGERFVLPDGRAIGVWTASLNTLLAQGSDPMKLAARLHGQCEIHAYVEGPNRAWLATIIEQGREIGFFRSGQGWPGVVALLRARDDEPVVTSYSVCDQFPNAGVAVEAALWTPRDDDEGWDAWYDLPDDEKWRLSLAAIRGGNQGLELTPERWDWPAFHFGEHPITGFHLREAADRLMVTAHRSSPTEEA